MCATGIHRNLIRNIRYTDTHKHSCGLVRAIHTVIAVPKLSMALVLFYRSFYHKQYETVQFVFQQFRSIRSERQNGTLEYGANGVDAKITNAKRQKLV